MGDKLLFHATDPATGQELWRTDGTETGTTLVKDVNPGATNGVNAFKAHVLGSRLIFEGITAGEGREIWASDGTALGTMLLADINPGATDSDPFDFVEFGGRVYFTARSAAAGRELWSTDGTPAGTRQQTDLSPGPGDGFTGFETLVVTHDETRLVFQGSKLSGTRNLVLSSDGTPMAEEVILDLVPGHPQKAPYVSSVASAAGIPASAPAPVSSLPPTSGYLLDGTAEGSMLHPGSLTGFNSSSTPIIIGTLNDQVMFAADDGNHGYELWKTDGTGSGTERITDINPGFAWSVAPELGGALIAGKLIFAAFTEEHGLEPWITDGTAAGTKLLKDINPGLNPSFPSHITAFDENTAVFGACSGGDAFDCELWKSDCTTAGTVLVKDIAEGLENSSSPVQFARLGDFVYFLATPESGPGIAPRIYRTDLTPQGTVLLVAGGNEFGKEVLTPYFFPYQPPGSSPTLLFPYGSVSQGFELFKIGSDECPSDANKTSPGMCGCGTPDDDADGDGTLDCLEECPSDPAKTVAGGCGCGIPDVDENGNGQLDCIDTQIVSVKPPRAKLRKRGKRIVVRLTPRDGVIYVVERRTFRKGRKKKKAYKAKIYPTPTFRVRKPAVGKVLQLRYKYRIIGDDSLESLMSRPAKRAG